MRRLDLDFQLDASRIGTLGWAVLGLAVAAAFYVFGAYLGALGERAQIAARVVDAKRSETRTEGRLEPGAPRPGVALTSQSPGTGPSTVNTPINPVAPSLASELDRVERILERPANLSAMLFREIESDSDRLITITSIQTNADERDLRIGGETASMTALAKWVDRLAARNTLASVYLSSHEWHRVGGRDMVGFSVTAKWGEDAP